MSISRAKMLICLLLFSTCFGQLCARRQEKITNLCDTWYLSLYINDCLVFRAEWKYQVSYRYGIFSWWWAHRCPKHVETSNKHIKGIFCTKLVQFTKDVIMLNIFKPWYKQHEKYEKYLIRKNEILFIKSNFISLYVFYQTLPLWWRFRLEALCYNKMYENVVGLTV